MVRLHRMTIIVASTGMLLLLAGCGQNTTGSANNTSQPAPSETPGTAQLVKTGIVPTKIPLHPSPTPNASPQINGEVTLQITAVPRNPGESIGVSLNNSTNQTILFSDHLTNCTVVLLQRESPASSGTWQAVAPCKLMTLTRLLSLAQGKSLAITLVPPGGHWTPGLYRAMLSYIPSSADHTAQTVFSPSFQIGS